MRRFFATLLLGAFLSLVGLQAAHTHEVFAPSSDTCAVCALAHQAQRQAPAKAPAVVRTITWAPVACPAARPTGAAPVRLASARAPPAFS